MGEGLSAHIIARHPYILSNFWRDAGDPTRAGPQSLAVLKVYADSFRQEAIAIAASERVDGKSVRNAML